jgi:hypothetical protein
MLNIIVQMGPVLYTANLVCYNDYLFLFFIVHIEPTWFDVLWDIMFFVFVGSIIYPFHYLRMEELGVRYRIYFTLY